MKSVDAVDPVHTTRCHEHQLSHPLLVDGALPAFFQRPLADSGPRFLPPRGSDPRRRSFLFLSDPALPRSSGARATATRTLAPLKQSPLTRLPCLK